MAVREPSFRFGCGRYLQSPKALDMTGVEVARHGRSAFIVGGKTALGIAEHRIVSSLEASNIGYCTEAYTGTCNTNAARELSDKAKTYDVVIGVGGGVIMDIAKLVAAYAKKPLINIPTSAATCAAFTPLSVCYTKEGRTVESLHHETEADGVIVDTEIMLTQTPRLLIAGAFDALAKYTEISHRYSIEGADTSQLGLDYAYHLSKKTYDNLLQDLDAALLSLHEHRVSEEFERVIFTLIAVTGVVSSIARGSSQTALAHKFYENARRHHTAESSGFLHGELVGVGLLLQNMYNGEESENKTLIKLMSKYGLPQGPTECGLPSDSATRDMYYDIFLSSSAMKEGGDKDRLKSAMERFWV